MEHDLALHADEGLAEREALLHADVLAARGAAALLPAARAAAVHPEELGEDVLEVGEDVAPGEVRHARAVDASEAELVVAGAFLLVGEDLVRLVDLFEAGLRLGVAGVAIGTPRTS